MYSDFVIHGDKNFGQMPLMSPQMMHKRDSGNPSLIFQIWAHDLNHTATVASLKLQ